ncbi:MAG: PrgI family protein [Bacteroidetes bacterium]|nr:PrgI family protein [Bacteroidota bacterium]
MRFQVPQFIDIEDKIFGPFTFKQFIYLVGGGGAAYALYKFLPTFVAILLIIPILGMAVALTFAKVNGKPFVEILQAYFSFLFKSKLFIWKQRKLEKKKTLIKEAPKSPTLSNIPRLTEGRLSDISWSLDVLDMGEKEK